MQRWRGSVAANRPLAIPPPRAEEVILRFMRIDWLLVAAITMIMLIGAAMLYSAAGGSASPWAGRHIIRYCVGLIVMLSVAMIGARRCFALAYPGYAICFLLLIGVEIAGSGAGATRWIDLGFMRLQPSELMKMTSSAPWEAAWRNAAMFIA